MAAGVATIEALDEEAFGYLGHIGDYYRAVVRRLVAELGLAVEVTGVRQFSALHYTTRPVRTPAGADGTLIGPGDPAEQAKACIDGVEKVLAAAGATLDDILRATCFGTTPEAVRAYIAERNSRLTQRVAATSVLVSERLLPGAMLEVEVIARMPARV